MIIVKIALLSAVTVVSLMALLAIVVSCYVSRLIHRDHVLRDGIV